MKEQKFIPEQRLVKLYVTIIGLSVAVVVLATRPKPAQNNCDLQEAITSAEEKAKGRTRWVESVNDPDMPHKPEHVTGLTAEDIHLVAVQRYGRPFANKMRALAKEVASEFRIPEAWVWYTWWVESRVNHRAKHPRTLAVGFQQITPETAETLGILHSSISTNPEAALAASRAWYDRLHANWVKAGKVKFRHIGYWYATQLAPETMSDIVTKKGVTKRGWLKTKDPVPVCYCGGSNPGFKVPKGGAVLPKHLEKFMYVSSGLQPVN